LLRARAVWAAAVHVSFGLETFYLLPAPGATDKKPILERGCPQPQFLRIVGDAGNHGPLIKFLRDRWDKLRSFSRFHHE